MGYGTLRYDGAAMQTMGDRIKALRQARGMSQQQLGDAVGVSKSAVSQWELGQTKDVKLATFMALVEVLHTDFAFLVYGPTRSGAPTVSGARKPRTGTP